MTVDCYEQETRAKGIKIQNDILTSEIYFRKFEILAPSCWICTQRVHCVRNVPPSWMFTLSTSLYWELLCWRWRHHHRHTTSSAELLRLLGLVLQIWWSSLLWKGCHIWVAGLTWYVHQFFCYVLQGGFHYFRGVGLPYFLKISKISYSRCRVLQT